MTCMVDDDWIDPVLEDSTIRTDYNGPGSWKHTRTRSRGDAGVDHFNPVESDITVADDTGRLCPT